ncbi:hypothetical protein H2200_002043 [Cladophialophora chaetospira]|uniref:Uncharacterized protein n=1 Tax=Cladophialophora chaetospira TaxID=386627 RepID=A0AA38XI54_9EURO|nr:hypothetical protein H2200_002043 [Cladophialophora chaetospira]
MDLQPGDLTPQQLNDRFLPLRHEEPSRWAFWFKAELMPANIAADTAEPRDSVTPDEIESDFQDVQTLTDALVELNHSIFLIASDDEATLKNCETLNLVMRNLDKLFHVPRFNPNDRLNLNHLAEAHEMLLLVKQFPKRPKSVAVTLMTGSKPRSPGLNEPGIAASSTPLLPPCIQEKFVKISLCLASRSKWKPYPGCFNSLLLVSTTQQTKTVSSAMRAWKTNLLRRSLSDVVNRYSTWIVCLNGFSARCVMAAAFAVRTVETVV